jgi:hypothetical protein
VDEQPDLLRAAPPPDPRATGPAADRAAALAVLRDYALGPGRADVAAVEVTGRVARVGLTALHEEHRAAVQAALGDGWAVGAWRARFSLLALQQLRVNVDEEAAQRPGLGVLAPYGAAVRLRLRERRRAPRGAPVDGGGDRGS